MGDGDGLSWIEGVGAFLAGPIAGGACAWLFRTESCTGPISTDLGSSPGLCTTSLNATAGVVAAVIGWAIMLGLVVYRELQPRA